MNIGYAGELDRQINTGELGELDNAFRIEKGFDWWRVVVVAVRRNNYNIFTFLIFYFYFS